MAIVYNSKGGVLTDLQAKRLFTTVDDIIDRLPSPTISQLFSGGYKRDMDKMLETIIDQTEYAMNFGRSLDTEKLGYVDNLFASMDENCPFQFQFRMEKFGMGEPYAALSLEQLPVRPRSRQMSMYQHFSCYVGWLFEEGTGHKSR